MDWAHVGKYLADGQYKRYMPAHLAVSFAVEAITQGYTALFLTADDLVAACRKANEKALSSDQ